MGKVIVIPVGIYSLRNILRLAQLCAWVRGAPDLVPHLSGFLGERNSSCFPISTLEVSTQRCLVCGSDEVVLWLGGSIGSLYHCTDRQYVGPVVIETDSQEVFGNQFGSFWDLVEDRSFWSETGIANRMLFQT
jgi:hypothetical protein